MEAEQIKWKGKKQYSGDTEDQQEMDANEGKKEMNKYLNETKRQE